MTDEEKQKKENLRAAYQAATSLMIYEADGAWARFQALLTAHTILVTLIGFLIKDGYSVSGEFAYFPILPAGGLILCIVWLYMTTRTHDIQKLWILSAREAEEKLEDSDMKIFTRGGEFSKNKNVQFGSKKPYVEHQRRLISRFLFDFNTEKSAWIVIILFGAFYLHILYASLSSARINTSGSSLNLTNCYSELNKCIEVEVNKNNTGEQKFAEWTDPMIQNASGAGFPPARE